MSYTKFRNLLENIFRSTEFLVLSAERFPRSNKQNYAHKNGVSPENLIP